MADVETLKGLLERVRAAKGPDKATLNEFVRPLDADLFETFGGPRWDAAYRQAQGSMGAPHENAVREARYYASRFTGSIDATVEAIGRILPGSTWAVFSDGTAWVWPDASMDLLKGHQGKAATPELALCAALLQALIARTETDGGRDA
ncbi:hypothetical protein [Methylorubrum sp. SB2]|uniref:hypothetical protein n=1 Tax=Methylorubrum subtropicum TaxID=3138812 RepID=UPI00313D8EFB